MKAAQKEVHRFRTYCNSLGSHLDNSWNVNSRQTFFSRFQNDHIPDYLCWIYGIDDGDFVFVGNKRNYYVKSDITFCGLVSKIKLCFQSQFIDALICYFKLLQAAEVNTQNYLTISLPLRFGTGSCLYCKISIVPYVIGTVIYGFAIIVIPIKNYMTSKFHIELKNNGLVDEKLTLHIKNGIGPPNLKLTRKQLQVVAFTQRGWGAERTSKAMGCGTDAIYKINGRLIQKISDYYGIDFLTVKDAVDYYSAPFI